MGFCLPPNRDSSLKVLCENLLTVDQIGETFAAAHRDNTFNVAVGVDSGGNLPAARTGIEIHPGATIGHRLVIDHGMGIVIGETAEIGDDCLLYQGVTLGGTGKDKGKRHPTLGNNVMVGSGAKVLGPFTVGDNARIAAGAVVLSAVPEDCTAVGVPAHVVRVAGKIATFADEVDQISVRDPVEEKLNAALSRLEFLEKLMDEQYLKSRREESAGSET